MAYSETKGFQADDSLAQYPLTTLKNAAWLKAPFAKTSRYQEAQFSTDLAQSLSSNSAGSSRRFDGMLQCGQNECILPHTIEILADVTLTVDGSAKWVITEDGVRPSGVASDFVGVKPKVGFAPACAATATGIRIPRYSVLSQFSKITAQIDQAGTIIDTFLYSHTNSSGTLMEHTILDQYSNRAGIIAADPDGLNDFTANLPDMFGTYPFTVAEATTNSNSYIDSYRVKDGTKTVLTREKPMLKSINDERCLLLDVLSSALTHMRPLPVGMPLKLQFDVADSGSVDRLDTGIVVSKNTTNADVGPFVDAPVKLSFSNITLRYQTIEVPQWLIEYQREGVIDGSLTIINAEIPMTGQLNAAPITRTNISDITIYSEGLGGEKQKQLPLNTNLNDMIPAVIGIFVYKPTAFTAAGFGTTNWDCMSWAEDKILNVRITSSGGTQDRATFMDFLPNGDYNQNRPAETTLSHNMMNHQLFLEMPTIQHSCLAQQAGGGYYTWQNRGYTKAKMPARAGFFLYTDPSMGVLPDLCSGARKGAINIVVEFSEALGAEYRVMAVQWFPSQVTYQIKQRNMLESTVQYDVVPSMSGRTGNL